MGFFGWLVVDGVGRVLGYMRVWVSLISFSFGIGVGLGLGKQ